ncbi:uroporphyrinogen-III synthase [Hydrogenivirga sp. 128-5-R1-1]|uniref:uroporphyrinogen-III synthase n=1 Tax=Hydrogenivirga sp. 128-5-R1-1 TaxID=392423 RepID=UPI00015EF904|nr:uroporphyrinogen-III synthase [Hydrogenivirga sp. 128-5-R1-1]EDP75235.1 uroporphyrinogen-III synthetase [Hydrogenivirga sp. 128-5-R1-1]
MGGRLPKRVILTRSVEDIERDRKLFEKYRFEVVELPLIRTEPLDFQVPKDSYEYVVFQSAKAVKHFLKSSDIPKGVKVIAVGNRTREELERLGYKVWLVPKDMSAEGVVNEFPLGRGETVLIPRSEQGRDEAVEGLSSKGYRVVTINVYRTSKVSYSEEEVVSILKGGGFIVFASPSAVRSFFANLRKGTAKAVLNDLVVVSIGKTTKKELEKFGVTPAIVPPKPLMEEVTGKIHEFWQENCIS